MTIPPCRGCEDRAQGCHSTCERYAAWKVRVEAERQERNRQKELEYALAENQAKRSEKSLRTWKKRRLK